MTEYNPDSWVILKMTFKDQVIYKVLAGWSGSYTHGSSWKLNSGITKAEDVGDAYLFHGHSGSTYRCPKGRYGLAMATSDIYETMIRGYSSQVIVLDYCEWDEFDFGEAAIAV